MLKEIEQYSISDVTTLVNLMTTSCQKINDSQLDRFDLELETKYFDGLCDAINILTGTKFALNWDDTQSRKTFRIVELDGKENILTVLYTAIHDNRR